MEMNEAERQLLKQLLNRFYTEVKLNALELNEKEMNGMLSRDGKKFQTSVLSDMATARDLIIKLGE